MDADLIWRCVNLVELLCGLDQDALDVVAGSAVGDDNDVNGAGSLDVVTLVFTELDVGLEDPPEGGAGRGGSAGANGGEEAVHIASVRDSAIASSG